ncbi:MAG: VWA domain-containing protein, partial [Candidatus Eisenbacteria sp.]|nr:VWA domain-containing protein [Candidatus Eisenbacteria bacterium]
MQRFSLVFLAALIPMLSLTAVVPCALDFPAEFDQSTRTIEDRIIELQWYPHAEIQRLVDHYEVHWSVGAESGQIDVPAQQLTYTLAIDTQMFFLPSDAQVEVQVHAIDSAQELIGLGELDNALIFAQETLGRTGGRLPILGLSDRGFEDAQFPTLFAWVGVDSTGLIPQDSLPQSAFEVYEDGALITDCFQVELTGSGQGNQLDFVFLIDHSGSMIDEITDVRNNVEAFATGLEALGYDVKFGYVRFGYSSDPGYPIPYVANNGNLYDTAADLANAIPESVSGGIERGCQAAIDAVNEINFRVGSLKQFLLITDEDSDGGDCQHAINLCNINGINIHGAVDCNEGSAQAHYCNGIIPQTDGLLFAVRDPFDQLFD